VVFFDTALVSPFSAVTGLDGIATTPWFVGKHAGTESLTARVEGLVSVVFAANVRADAPYQMGGASDFEQLGAPGQVAPSSPTTRVVDQYGNVTAGVTVTFTAAGPADPGTTTRTAITDVNGLASYGFWTLGTVPGEYTITANFSGQTSPPVTFRARINKPFSASLLAAGGTATCAVAVSGGLYCWGDGLFSSSTTTPTPVASAVSFASLAMGRSHGCGLTSSGAAYCWGNNGIGELGIGSLSANESQPRAVAGGLTFASIAAGDSFTCGLTTDQRVLCWGDNTVGELGNGSTTASTTPVPITATEHFTALAAGYGHVCAIATTGAIYCWGANNTGQLGATVTDVCMIPGFNYYGDLVTTQVQCSKKPIALPNTPGTFSSLVASNGTCGLTAGAQTAACWGYPSYVPVSPASFLSLAAAGNSICGITAVNQLIICWSYDNPYDYGVTIPPAIIYGVAAPTSLVAGSGHWCAISGTAGAVYCWGNNGGGQLGDGLHTPSTIALPVAAP
jgi:alpha-tubulin suppressor-like RCC1 family protein